MVISERLFNVTVKPNDNLDKFGQFLLLSPQEDNTQKKLKNSPLPACRRQQTQADHALLAWPRYLKSDKGSFVL